MLMRIVLIVAILAAIGAGTLNLVEVHQKINTLMTQRNDYHTARDKYHTQLNNTNQILVATRHTLDQTRQQLTDSKAAQKKAEDLAAAQRKRADDLATQLTKVTQDRDTAQADLQAYKGTGLTAPEVLKLVAQIKDDTDAIAALNEENKVLDRKRLNLQNQLNELIGTNYVVALPAGLKGNVVTVDPKWDFVILNIGYDQGLLTNGEMLVSRNGKLVAKVIVRRMDKDRSVANIMPGFKLGDVYEGDEVTPAHPAG